MALFQQENSNLGSVKALAHSIIWWGCQLYGRQWCSLWIQESTEFKYSLITWNKEEHSRTVIGSNLTFEAKLTTFAKLVKNWPFGEFLSIWALPGMEQCWELLQHPSLVVTCCFGCFLVETSIIILIRWNNGNKNDIWWRDLFILRIAKKR